MSVRLHYAKEYKITWGGAGGMPFYSRELLRVIDLYDAIYYKDDGDDEVNDCRYKRNEAVTKRHDKSLCQLVATAFRRRSA